MASIPETLLDPRTGVIRSVEPRALHKHLPQGLKLYKSVISDTTRFSDWPSDPSAAGCVLWDEEAAVNAAIGEAIERYCGNLVPPNLLRGSYNELTAAGIPAVDPLMLALHSMLQYQQPGFPFVPFTRDLPVRWAQGRELINHQPIWVPASLVWHTYLRVTPRAEPRTNIDIGQGIAAGKSRDDAEWSAMRELIEGDACFLAWVSGGPLCPVEVPSWLARLAQGPTGDLWTRFYEFPNEFGMPVLGALTVDRRDRYMTMGTACRSDPVEAMLKAFAESVQSQMIVRDLDDPASAMSLLAGRPASPLKPWREDRHYLSAYRSDWRDVTDPGCHLQLYLDPAMQELLEHELSNATARPARALDPAPAESVSEAAGRLGLPVYSVDVTTDDIRGTGLRVVRLVAPGLYSETPASYPFLGGTRLQDRIDATPGREPRLLPLPH